MSSATKKRARAVCIRAYELSLAGFTNREISALIFCTPEQVPGKVKAGKLASIRDERSVTALTK